MCKGPGIGSRERKKTTLGLESAEKRTEWQKVIVEKRVRDRTLFTLKPQFQRYFFCGAFPDHHLVRIYCLSSMVDRSVLFVVKSTQACLSPITTAQET
jgi:hypothetical protein